MKERPILFSSPMVRAILEGRKTQTRRVLKINDASPSGAFWDHSAYEPIEIRHGVWAVRATDAKSLLTGASGSPIWKCPYGTAGDRLWVRETWRLTGGGSANVNCVYRAEQTEPKMSRFPAAYRALGLDDLGRKFIEKDDRTKFDRYGCEWHPSIHMPRWASRITLEIVSVRVERVQSISEEDAKAEGIERGARKNAGFFATYPKGDQFPGWTNSTRDSFRSLWDSINEKRGFGWDVNPWVWVIQFRRLMGGAK